MAHPAHAHGALHPTVRRNSYARRRPEEGVLYQAVQAHWPLLLEDLAEHGGLPKFVVREFEEYLRCGILSAGCLHLVSFVVRQDPKTCQCFENQEERVECVGGSKS